MQNTAGGTAGDSDAAETSNEHRRTAREQDGSNVALVTYWQYAVALALVKLAVNQVVTALAAVLANNARSICVNDASRDPYTSSVFHGDLQHRRV